LRGSKLKSSLPLLLKMKPNEECAQPLSELTMYMSLSSNHGWILEKLRLARVLLKKKFSPSWMLPLGATATLRDDLASLDFYVRATFLFLPCLAFLRGHQQQWKLAPHSKTFSIH